MLPSSGSEAQLPHQSPGHWHVSELSKCTCMDFIRAAPSHVLERNRGYSFSDLRPSMISQCQSIWKDFPHYLCLHELSLASQDSFLNFISSPFEFSISFLPLFILRDFLCQLLLFTSLALTICFLNLIWKYHLDWLLSELKKNSFFVAHLPAKVSSSYWLPLKFSCAVFTWMGSSPFNSEPYSQVLPALATSATVSELEAVYLFPNWIV